MGKIKIIAIKVVLDTNCLISALLFSKKNMAWLLLGDKADQKFSILAVANNAEALVTGDQDLLVIIDTFKILPIMTLNGFEQWLQCKLIKNSK